ncbi:MAG: Copper binding protein plastocyanin/azurin family [Chloroflexota bacterium]|jgi:uncharacterized cupredoxin-like copper-binding protein|nr:Copper binding protein plastocyanin/azurin family [Chloroflexota bacterium]
MRSASILAGIGIAIGIVTGGCDAGVAPATPPIRPGSSVAPREVNVVLKDWLVLPDPVDIVAGETVVLHVVNGGLEIHELVIGGPAVQDAWESAEAAAADPPPGPTPVVSVAPSTAGIRVVVPSGQRIELTWTAPDDASTAAGMVLGCHIPGHWAKGMHAGLRLAPPHGSTQPLGARISAPPTGRIDERAGRGEATT